VAGVRSLVRHLPFATLHRRSLTPLCHAGHLDPETLDTYVDWMAGPDGSRWLLRFFADYRTSPRPELRARLAEITCPTAVIWGRKDPYLAPGIATDLAANIPQAELTMLSDAGHWLLDEQPQTTTKALQHLLTRRPRP
jgi:pimeloyl-ACP methyl ester carboxylesterase